MDLVGTTLGNYRVSELIGQGGMASVFRATQTTLNRDVAIKVLSGLQARDPIFRQRFIREAKAVAQLSHPNIVQIFDFGDNADLGILYIVMELITGGSLRDFKNRQVPVEEAVPIIATVAQALTSAHQRGIIHRDIKPNNILISGDSRPMLSDFGLAQMGEGSLYTESGTTVGTPAYMSPEQVMGEKLDGRADIYSLGMVLYELLAGRPAFQAETPLALLHQQVYEQPTLPRQINTNIPRSLEAVLMRAIAKDRNERHRTSDEFSEELLKSINKDASDATVRVRMPSVNTIMSTDIAPVRSPTHPVIRIWRNFNRRVTATFVWLVKNFFKLAAGFALTLVALSLIGAGVVAVLTERVLGDYPWQWNQFKTDQATVFEDARMQGQLDYFMNSLGARAGVLPLIKLHFKPDEILQAQVDSALGAYYIDTRVYVLGGVIQTDIESVNGYTPYIINTILSGGINRGLRRAFEKGPVRVDSVESAEGQLTTKTKLRANVAPPANHLQPTPPTSVASAAPALAH